MIEPNDLIITFPSLIGEITGEGMMFFAHGDQYIGKDC